MYLQKCDVLHLKATEMVVVSPTFKSQHGDMNGLGIHDHNNDIYLASRWPHKSQILSIENQTIRIEWEPILPQVYFCISKCMQWRDAPNNYWKS